MGIPEPVYTDVGFSDFVVELIISGIFLYIFAVMIYYSLKLLLGFGYDENDKLEENDEEVNE